mgnify:CR=1 FL=1
MTYSLAIIRDIARAWCEYATDGDRGRRLKDPIYQQISEFRDHGRDYSSCGDLAHWLLYRLGCREGYVNRVESGHYKSGYNVNLLHAPPVGSNGSAEVWNGDFESLETGDILVYWSNATATNTHVDVFDSYSDGALSTWDYGQGAFGGTGGDPNPVEALKKTRLTGDMVRPIKSVLRLKNVKFSVEPELPLGYQLPPTGEIQKDGTLLVGLALAGILIYWYVTRKP